MFYLRLREILAKVVTHEEARQKYFAAAQANQGFVFLNKLSLLTRCLRSFSTMLLILMNFPIFLTAEENAAY